MQTCSMQSLCRKGPIILRHSITPAHSCFIEVRAVVVVVQQPLAECTAILTVCFVEHHLTPWTVTIHKTSANQQWNGFQDSAQIKHQCGRVALSTFIEKTLARCRINNCLTCYNCQSYLKCEIDSNLAVAKIVHGLSSVRQWNWWDHVETSKNIRWFQEAHLITIPPKLHHQYQKQCIITGYLEDKQG